MGVREDLESLIGKTITKIDLVPSSESYDGSAILLAHIFTEGEPAPWRNPVVIGLRQQMDYGDDPAFYDVDGFPDWYRADCTRADHDHDRYVDEDGNSLDEADTSVSAMCPDCGRPTHYDSAVEDHRHDNPLVSCFLIKQHPEQSRCVPQDASAALDGITYRYEQTVLAAFDEPEFYKPGVVAVLAKGGRAIAVQRDGESRFTLADEVTEYRTDDHAVLREDFPDGKLPDDGNGATWANNGWFDLYDADTGEHLDDDDHVAHSLAEAIADAEQLLTAAK